MIFLFIHLLSINHIFQLSLLISMKTCLLVLLGMLLIWSLLLKKNPQVSTRLNKELKHPLVPLRIQEFYELMEWARIIEIDLTAPTFIYEVGFEYDVSRRTSRYEPSREIYSDKKSMYSDLWGCASVAYTSRYGKCIHCDRWHGG